jgi:uroporphyrinogen decarboxylase
MEELLMDMIAEPQFVHSLMEKITEHHLELLDQVLDYDFDAVYFGDDWGAQRGLIFGKTLWQKFIKPYLKQLCAKVKSKDKNVILHSCGNIWEILDQVIEIGVDCYNTVQPEIYDLNQLVNEFGKDLTFYGGISNQTFLPNATPEEVEKKCLETMEVLNRYHGYILSPTHSVTPDIPIENLFAIVKAAKKYMA